MPDSVTASDPIGGYRPEIDGLRAVAVISVLLFHAFPDLLPGGFAGVDVFFVISGFLIGGILIDARQRGTFTYHNFYARRIRRLFPALLTVLATVLVAGFLLLLPSDYRLLGKHVAAGAGFASNLVLLRESGYFDTASALKPLLHLWSLGVEEQFYILCPLILAWFSRSRIPLSLTITIFALVSFVLGLYWLESAPQKAFFHPAARFWELFAGVALAALQRQSPTAALASPVWLRALRVLSPEVPAVVGMTLLVTGFVVLREGIGFPGAWALLPVIGALLLIGPAADSKLIRILLANRLAVFVGLISYPLYLWHWPLLSLSRIHQGGEPSAVWRLGLLGLAVFAAWATWRWIETPLRHPRPGLPATRLLSIGMIVVGVAGAGVLATDGVSSRYPAEIRAIAGLDYDGKKEARAGKCFLKTEQVHTDFDDQCLAPARQAGRPVVVLWGDSHAGHLYPGLAQLADEAPGFALVQLTSSGCPPVLGISVAVRPACRATNDYVFDQIRAMQPGVVVLAGYWHQYFGVAGWDRMDPAALRATIVALRAQGVARVVVVGQVPIWLEPQPRLILRLWEEQALIVDQTALALDTDSLAADKRVREYIAATDAAFVSPVDLFCRDGQCMTFSGTDRREPVAFDYGHLTRSASLRVAEAIRAAFPAAEKRSHE